MNLALYQECARQMEKLERTDQVDEFQALAFESYKAALAADPTESTIHYNVAYFYLHQRSFDKKGASTCRYLRSRERMRRGSVRHGIIRETSRLYGMGCSRRHSTASAWGRKRKESPPSRRFSLRDREFRTRVVPGWANRRLARYAEGRDAFMKALELGSPHAQLCNARRAVRKQERACGSPSSSRRG